MIPELVISDPMRPYIPGYGISEEAEGMLHWSIVDKWMKNSKNYWISTSLPNGNPHARPIWGIWYGNMVFIGGGETTRSFRNLKTNPNIVVHTESGDETVIIEGKIRKFEDKELCTILSQEYDKKYGMEHPPPFWGIIPNKVFAWAIEDYAKTPTKWTIKASDK